MGKRREAILIIAILLLCPGTWGRADPQTGRIRLLHIGLAFMRPDHPDPVFLQDPKIDLTMVPAFEWVMGDEEIRRSLRLYLPRSSRDLNQSHDLVLIDGIDAMHIRQDFLTWVKDLVLESSLCFGMCDSGSGWSFAGSGTNWYQTAIEPVLPVDDEPGREGSAPSFMANQFYMVPVDSQHPLMRGIPWKEQVWVAMNRPTARPGAKVIARMSEGSPVNRDKPAIVRRDYPRGGRSVAYIFGWHTMVDSPHIMAFYRWEWHLDVLAHMIYWPAREPIPKNLALVHSVRQLISDLYFSKAYAISIMEFAERSGANMRETELELAQLQDRRSEVEDLYVENEMDECYDLCSELKEGYQDLVERAMKSRDKALLWIFVLEWLVVTATSMVCGFILWTLMVKRKLYQEVSITRPGRVS